MAPKKKILIIVSTLIIILLIVLGAIFIFININKSGTQYNIESSTTPISIPTSSSVQDNNSKYIKKQYEIPEFNNSTLSATLPEGYTLKVFTDVVGMYLKVDNVNYRGVTGIKIYNSQNKEMISISGVSGIGLRTNVKDCTTSSSYKEFSFFGEKVRLNVDNTISQPTAELTNNPFCQPIFYKFADIYFTSGTNAKNNLNESMYEIKIDASLSNDVLYEILSNLAISS